MASPLHGAASRSNVSMLLPVIALLVAMLHTQCSVAASSLGRRVDAGQGLNLLPLARRRLLNAPAAAATTSTPIIVNSFEELNDAVINGATDVEVRSHIDSTSTAPDGVSVLPDLQETRSIRVCIYIIVIFWL